MLKELSATKLDEVQGGVTATDATSSVSTTIIVVGGAASGDNVIHNSGTTIIGNATGIVVPRVVVPRVVRPVRGQ
ncbi:hypothetical protein [Deinococcus sp.]|uniref:hypothetical protein n=1 Tax=Deinococcus sp. TaxID=47478 RepID=UPI003CC5CB33